MSARLVITAAAAALLLFRAVTPALADGYLSAIDDLPLMPGLSEKAASALLFDTPSGRVAESVAEGEVAADKVIAFYAAALPELGWVPVSPTQYRRDDETLRLDLAPGRRLTVRFIVTPGGSP